MGEEFNVELVVSNETANLVSVREFILNNLRRTDLEKSEHGKIVLAVDEAVSNIMRHAYESFATGTRTIEIRFNADNEKIILILKDSGKEFVPWSKHLQEYEFLGPVPWPPHNEPNIGEPYSKEDLLEFLDVCRNEVEEKVSSLDLGAASGFGWLPFDKLELQFYNIRHLQLHVGQLVDRLRNVQGVGIGWVGTKPEDD